MTVELTGVVGIETGLFSERNVTADLECDGEPVLVHEGSRESQDHVLVGLGLIIDSDRDINISVAAR